MPELQTLIRKQRAMDTAQARYLDAQRAYMEALRAALTAGASQSDIARTLGVSRQRVSQLLRGV